MMINEIYSGYLNRRKCHILMSLCFATQMLKKKLRERLEVRQKAMEDQQRLELQEILSTSKNKTAMRIKEALLLHKQMLAMEQFR